MGLFDNCDVRLELHPSPVPLGGVVRGAAHFTIAKQTIAWNPGRVRGLRVEAMCEDSVRYAADSDAAWNHEEVVWWVEIPFAGAPSKYSFEPSPDALTGCESCDYVLPADKSDGDDDDDSDDTIECVVKPGSYVCPFEIVVPDTLPPTFAYHTPTLESHVRYKVRAYIDTRHRIDREASADFVVTAPIPVRALRAIPTRMPSTEQPLSFLLPFFTKGSVAVDCCLTQGVLAPAGAPGAGEQAPRMILDLNLTGSNAPVRKIMVEIVAKVVVTGSEWREVNESTHVEQPWGKSKLVIRGPFAEGSKHVVTRPLPLPQYATTVAPRAPFGVTTTSSFVSRSVRLEHCVRIELDMPWTTNPTFDVPVFYTPTVQLPGAACGTPMLSASTPSKSTPSFTASPSLPSGMFAPSNSSRTFPSSPSLGGVSFIPVGCRSHKRTPAVVGAERRPYVVPAVPVSRCVPVPGFEPHTAEMPVALTVEAAPDVDATPPSRIRRSSMRDNSLLSV